MSKRTDKDQVGIAYRLASKKGQNYKELNHEKQQVWYQRAGVFIALEGGIDKAELILDFLDGADING